MAKQISEIAKLAYEDYKAGMKYQAIAEKHGVSLNTVKSWKTRHNWTRDKNAKKVRRKRGGQPGNKNAVGNGAPKGNKYAEKHGFFSKWLPKETAEIVGLIELSKPLDILWYNITLQYTAIIRAQKLMYVSDQNDITVAKKGMSQGNGGSSVQFDIQQAWDKHASFLNAQSRAMETLKSMIRQYDELLHKDWELATSEQKERIEHLKASTAKIRGDDLQEGEADDGFLDALSGKADGLW